MPLTLDRRWVTLGTGVRITVTPALSVLGGIDVNRIMLGTCSHAIVVAVRSARHAWCAPLYPCSKAMPALVPGAKLNPSCHLGFLSA
jgi:hypothetical protein